MNEFVFRARATRRPYSEIDSKTKEMRTFDALVIEAFEAHAYPADWPKDGVDVFIYVEPMERKEEQK